MPMPCLGEASSQQRARGGASDIIQLEGKGPIHDPNCLDPRYADKFRPSDGPRNRAR